MNIKTQMSRILLGAALIVAAVAGVSTVAQANSNVAPAPTSLKTLTLTQEVRNSGTKPTGYLACTERICGDVATARCVTLVPSTPTGPTNSLYSVVLK